MSDVKTGANTGRFQTGTDPRRGAGKKGRSGRPPSVIREKLRGSFAKRIKILEQIADGTAIVNVKLPDGSESKTLVSAPIADRIKALDMLAKYGLGTTITETDTEGNDILIRVRREHRPMNVVDN